MGKRNREETTTSRQLREIVNTYLQESSIHGLRYLASDARGRKNLRQVLFWSCVTLAAFGFATGLILRSFGETHKFPIITTVDSVSIKKVPFPAVTINAGQVLNPWGFVEKYFRIVDYECYDDPFHCPAQKEAVREDLKFLSQAVVERFFEVVVERLKLDSLKDLRIKRNKEVSLAKDVVFSEFEEAAATLALLIDKKQSRAKAVLRKLAEATATSLAKFTPTQLVRSKGWGSRYLSPIVAEEAEWYNISAGAVDACLQQQSCPNETVHVEAYATMLLPFYFNRVPYQGLEIGQLISYFTKRVLTTRTKNQEYNMFLNRRRNNLYPGEMQMAEFLTDLTDKFASSPVEVTMFEIAKLFDLPHSQVGKEPQVNYLGDFFDCSLRRDTEAYYSAWESYIRQEARNVNQQFLNQVVPETPCTNDTLDGIMGISGCCSMAKDLRQRRELIMKLMKYSMQAPHFLQSREELEKEFSEAPDVFPSYTLKPLTNESALRSDNPRIHMCQYDREPADEDSMPSCRFFVRSYTNEGFGYSFNNRHFWNKHSADNTFNQRFYSQMHPVPKRGEPDVYYPQSSGSFHGLNVVLVLNKYEEAIQLTTRKKTASTFRITLHDPFRPADLRSEGVEVMPGYLSTFLVTPSQVVTSPSIEGVDLRRRNCKFRGENGGLKVFREYTQSACVFECMLAQATDRCKCVPWNYPQLNDTSEMCDYMGAYCFEAVSALDDHSLG